MKLSEIINERYIDIASELPPEIIPKIKQWYDEGVPYPEIATRLNLKLGRYALSFDNVVSLLNKIYPERNLRIMGGQWRPGHAPSRPPKYRESKPAKVDPRDIEQAPEMIKMYTSGAALNKISRKFSRTVIAIDRIINSQPNAADLRKARRTSLGI